MHWLNMFNKKFLLIKKFEIFIFIFNSVLLTLKYKYIQATNCINIVERARPATPKAGIKNKCHNRHSSYF